MKTNNARTHVLGMAAALIVLCGVWPASAEPITNASFFTSIPHRLITFELDGAGQPLVLYNGQSRWFSPSEYAAQGITFQPAIEWVNDSSPAFDAAQAIGGSPTVSIKRYYQDVHEYLLRFVVPVRAFGFWVVHDDWDTNQSSLAALNSAGQVIEEVTFGAEFRQGTAGGRAGYGFMGIAANQDIVSVRVREYASEFDNFYFCPVPEPRPSIRVSRVEVSWDTVTNRWYQLNGRDTAGTNQWVPLTTWISGDGLRCFTNDTVPADQGQRFYRVAWTNAAPQP